MLDAATPPRLIGGHPVFADHEDPSLHYVFPGPPRLANVVETGRPEVSLALFRSVNGPSGGLLGLTTELTLTEEDLDRIVQGLRADGVRAPRLVIPPWRAGTARLAGWLGDGSGTPWAHHVLGSTLPALTPDGRATFSALLTEDGAALAHGALRGGALPVVVVYELETLGLTGPLGVRIEADVHRTWERLTLEAQIESRYYARAEASAVFERAIELGEVRVTVVDQSGDVSGRRATAVQLAGQAFAAELFTLGAPRAEVGGLKDGTSLNLELAFMLRTESEVVHKQVTWDFEERRPRVVRHHTAASLGHLTGADPGSLTVRELDGDELLLEHTALRVAPSVPLSAAGLAEVTVEVRWEDPTTSPTSAARLVTLSEAVPTVVAHLPSQVTEPWWYRAEAVGSGRGGVQRRPLSAWRRGTGQVLVVPLGELFGLRRHLLMLGRLEADWMSHLELKVERGGDTETHALSTVGERVELILPEEASPARLTEVWHARSGEILATVGPWELLDEVVVLSPPYLPSLPVTLMPVFDHEIVLVEARLEVHSAEGVVLHAVDQVVLGGETAPTTILLRRPTGAVPGYSYALTRHDLDGTVRVEQGHSGASVLVIGHRDQAVWPARVVLLRGSPAARGDLAVVLHLVGRVDGVEVDRQSIVLEGTTSEADLYVRTPNTVEPTLVVEVERHTVAGVVRSEVAVRGGLAPVLD
jgi:hypothetical protein